MDVAGPEAAGARPQEAPPGATAVLVDELLRQGWSPPPELHSIDDAPVERSLSEDLAVARARGNAAVKDSRHTQVRARSAVASGIRLQADVRRALAAAQAAHRDRTLTVDGLDGLDGPDGVALDGAVHGIDGHGPSADAALRGRIRELEEEVAQLRTGLANRPAIEHVVGMLMLIMSCDADSAFRTLTYVSQRTNRKVREISEALAAQVARGEGIPEDLVRVLHQVLPPESRT